MSLKELTELTVSDLFEGFNRDFWNYWKEYDNPERVFKNNLSEETLETERGMLAVYGPYKRIYGHTDSDIVRSLDANIAIYHERRFEHRYLYLFLDGVVLRIRTGFGMRKKVVLVAYGIRFNGRRELIDFKITKCDGEGVWESFLNNLHRRGLTGNGLELVIIDGNAGLINASGRIYPYDIKRQRCWVHKLRGVANYIGAKDRDKCLKDIRTIYGYSDRKEAVEAYNKWAEKWRTVYPEAVRSIEKDLDELLSFYNCPHEIRDKLRTMSVIESTFKEVRRRTGPVRCFNNTQSIERIVYAEISHLNERWRMRP